MPTKKQHAKHSGGFGFLASLAVAIAVFVIFAAVVGNDFLSWDDEDFLVGNQAFRGFGAANLRYIFTDAGTFGYFAPVTWLSFAVDHYLSGVSARGVHLHNLVLHAINAVLLYLLAVKLLAHALPGHDTRGWAAAAALLFALHPLRVEPVAWASARGYLLAGTFALAALISYVKHVEREASGLPVGPWLVLCYVCYLLTVFAVPVSVGLPLVMLVLDVYPLRRGSSSADVVGVDGTRRSVRGFWLEKIPLFAIAIVAAGLAPLAKSTQGSLATAYSAASGLALAAYGLAFGVIKSVLPIRLSPLYQLYPGFSPAEPTYIVAALFVIAMTVLLVSLRRRFPAGLTVWIAYLVLMLPVSGLVSYGLQVTADRYTYVAGIGLALLGAGLGAWWQGRRANQARMPVVIAAVVIVVFAAMTWRYIPVWRDSQHLWQRVVELDGRSYTGLNNLAIEMGEQGKIGEAIVLFERAAAANPAYPPLRNNLGHIAAAQGRLDEAIAHYEAYLATKPSTSASAKTSNETRIMLSTVLARAGRIAEAIEQARLVEGEKADASKLHALITGKLIDQGYDGAAIAVTRAGLVQMPNDPVLLNNLAWLLATSYDPACRSGAESLASAKQMIVAMEGRRRPLPQFFATLAAAYAEQGDFDQAIEEIGKAIAVARLTGDSDRIKEYGNHLSEYRAQQPHRELPPPPSPWGKKVSG